MVKESARSTSDVLQNIDIDNTYIVATMVNANADPDSLQCGYNSRVQQLLSVQFRSKVDPTY